LQHENLVRRGVALALIDQSWGLQDERQLRSDYLWFYWSAFAYLPKMRLAGSCCLMESLLRLYCCQAFARINGHFLKRGSRKFQSQPLRLLAVPEDLPGGVGWAVEMAS